MKTFRTGLVVGKFAPLHRGHQLLLDEADRACDRVVILSYSNPEFLGCGPTRRERWLRRLYPRAMVHVLDDSRLAQWCDAKGVARVELPPNDAPDDVHRRFVGWLLRVILKVDIEAVFTSEAYGDGFVQVLNELGISRTPIVHVEIDRARTRVPVSGTTIRRDLHTKRQFLDPRVYSDFVKRVAVLGGESTGKTTLAQALAGRLATAWVPEYGRELWHVRAGRLRFTDMLQIACEQIRREDAAASEAVGALICDTTPLTTALYSEVLFGRVDPALMELSGRPYDHVLLCAPDFAFVQDGTRSDAAFRDRQHARYVRELTRRGIAFQLLRGSVETRLECVLESIGVGAMCTGKAPALGQG